MLLAFFCVLLAAALCHFQDTSPLAVRGLHVRLGLDEQLGTGHVAFGDGAEEWGLPILSLTTTCWI